jgi:D-methionine transport system permease protein
MDPSAGGAPPGPAGSIWSAALAFDYWPEIGQGTLDTLVMTGLSLLFTVLIGLPLGVALFLTGWSQRSERRSIARLQFFTYSVLSLLVNVLRSVPFLILLILLIPATRWIVGTSLGVRGSIPPLVIASAPFFSRLIENLLREVDRGVFEACRSIGATTRQTVLWALLPETFPGILAAIIVTAVALVGYSAMSGVIGGGGLGDLAVRYGYQRFNTSVMLVTVAILVVMVQLIQVLGDRVVARFSHR